MGEICSCSCLTVLPGSARVLHNKIYKLFFILYYALDLFFYWGGGLYIPRYSSSFVKTPNFPPFQGSLSEREGGFNKDALSLWHHGRMGRRRCRCISKKWGERWLGQFATRLPLFVWRLSMKTGIWHKMGQLNEMWFAASNCSGESYPAWSQNTLIESWAEYFMLCLFVKNCHSWRVMFLIFSSFRISRVLWNDITQWEEATARRGGHVHRKKFLAASCIKCPEKIHPTIPTHSVEHESERGRMFVRALVGEWIETRRKSP